MSMNNSCRFLVFLSLVGCWLAVSDGEQPVPPAQKKPTNHLAKETSPYLRQHAHNPVDWYPWGDEAFAKAKKEGKLIFLSIGYSSCHWCHVMERESFSNEAVAALLNKHFVCIKVDREERPDIDHVYMTALHESGSRGGWPLTMFLTADGKPLGGGTYWPPEDKEIDGQKIRGLKSVLNAVVDFRKEHPEELAKSGDQLAERTRRALDLALRDILPVELKRDLVVDVVDFFKGRFDAKEGGFGTPPNFRGPKFPSPPMLKLLQSEATRSGSKELKDMVHTTLTKMVRGGIYDQIGGGFHRYSTERTWTVPHFEKMLYDNAQLLELYARAYTETKDPLYRSVLEETLQFIDREMTSPEGVFYAALDADSEGEEGRFYVWTDAQLEAALPDRTSRELIKNSYGMDGKPNFEEKSYIPVLKQVVADKDAKALHTARLILRQARDKRPRPFLDTKVLTSWNGEMIAGLARAGQALGDKQATARAVRAADFLLKTLKTKDGRLLHTYAAIPGEKAQARLNAYLDDYTALVDGLLVLHDTTGEARWLNEARALTDTMIELFAADKGGFYSTSSDHEKLFVRAREQYDGVQPCGNSQAALNLIRLGKKTGQEKYRRLAEKTLLALAPVIKDEPGSMPTLAEALALYLEM
jgi:uncharacterized protein YyaL (SSP411 family)